MILGVISQTIFQEQISLFQQHIKTIVNATGCKLVILTSFPAYDMIFHSVFNELGVEIIHLYFENYDVQEMYEGCIKVDSDGDVLKIDKLRKEYMLDYCDCVITFNNLISNTHFNLKHEKIIELNL